MKAITLKQYKKMPARTKSWLLVKALGLWTRVFWHVTKDGSRAGIISGSMDSQDSAESLLDVAREKYPEDKGIRIRRDLCFLAFAESDALNPAHTLIKKMVDRGWSCNLWFNPPNRPIKCSAQFYNSDGASFFYDSDNIQDAICAAALQALKLMEPYPF